MSEALKFDGGKPRMDLLPHRPLQEVAKVLMFGLVKYAAHNWRLGTDWSRFVRAAQDHIGYWNEGEDLDPESKLSHLAHAVCCLLFLMWYQIFNVGNDDRYKGQVATAKESEWIGTTTVEYPATYEPGEVQVDQVHFADGTKFEMRNGVLHKLENGLVETVKMDAVTISLHRNDAPEETVDDITELFADPEYQAEVQEWMDAPMGAYPMTDPGYAEATISQAVRDKTCNCGGYSDLQGYHYTGCPALG